MKKEHEAALAQFHIQTELIYLACKYVVGNSHKNAQAFFPTFL